jgi:hypothetical protein
MKNTVKHQNYSPIPNAILDSVGDYTECEYKLLTTICRETFGWHRTWVTLSIADLVKRTKLSKVGVINGISTLVERRKIVKATHGKTNSYCLLIEGKSSAFDGGDGSNFLHTDSANFELGDVQILHTPNKGKKLLKETPLTPRGGNGLSESDEQIRLRIGRWFKRRDSTRWSARELKAFKALLPIPDDELGELEAYYAAVLPFGAYDSRRRSVLTLLNNWPGELDQARNPKSLTPPATSKGETPIWKQIQIIELTLEEHPANRMFRGYSKEKCTDEMREQYKQLKAKRDALRQQELQNTTSMDF